MLSKGRWVKGSGKAWVPIRMVLGSLRGWTCLHGVEPKSVKISIGVEGSHRAEEQMGKEEMEAACSWCKKHTHVLGTGLNQVVGGGSNEFGGDSGYGGYMRWGQGEWGSWSYVPGLSGQKRTELELGYQSGQEEAHAGRHCPELEWVASGDGARGN